MAKLLNKDKPCRVCGEPVKWKGLCRKHYYEEYNKNNKDRIREINRTYGERYKKFGPLTKEEKEYRKQQTKIRENKTSRRYRKNNIEKFRKRDREGRRKNWNKIKVRNRKRYKNDPQYRMRILLSNTLGKAKT